VTLSVLCVFLAYVTVPKSLLKYAPLVYPLRVGKLCLLIGGSALCVAVAYMHKCLTVYYKFLIITAQSCITQMSMSASRKLIGVTCFHSLSRTTTTLFHFLFSQFL